jgi:tetratricopeptide (TPR) repeat protein
MTFKAVSVAALCLTLLTAGCAPKVVAPAAPGAPRFPDFVYPVPGGSPESDLLEQQQAAWQLLQRGDLRGAERAFAATVKRAPAFYPAEAGLGYVALARKDYKGAVAHFDRVISANGSYAPALAGRGQAYLALDQRERALASFDAALAADPSLSGVRSAADVLRFQGLQGGVGAARKAAEAGRLAEARAAYEQAIAASPQSPFLFRELSVVERREGLLDQALAHAQRAIELEASDARNFVALADVLEAQGRMVAAADALATAASIDPSDALTARIEGLREKATFAAMPEEYRSIDQSPTVTRAQLAALLGVELAELIERAPKRTPAVLTDVRTSWANRWILNVTGAGIMEGFPNHTFQPDAVVRRGDLAAVVSRVLNVIALQNPQLAVRWRDARLKFGDLAPGHLSYPAASVAVEAGVMTAVEGNFELTRPVTGIEALAAVRKLEELAGTPRR